MVIDSTLFIIELDGREHHDSGAVRIMDTGKKEICRAHGFELIRVENSYAGRYNYIKNILIQYFKSVRVYQNIGNCETIYLKADVVQI